MISQDDLSEFTPPSTPVCALLCLRFLRPAVPGGLDADGFRLLRDHHSRSFRGVVRLHAGACRGGLGGREIHCCPGWERRILGRRILCGRGVVNRSGGFCGSALFDLGERFLLSAGQTDSIAYLSLSALVLALSILPWCLCMGATFPLMMAYVREKDHECTDSFSYLYLANVLGAMSGALSDGRGFDRAAGLSSHTLGGGGGKLDHCRHQRLAGAEKRSGHCLAGRIGPGRNPEGKPGSPSRTSAAQFDSSCDWLRGLGHGGGLGPRLHPGSENAECIFSLVVFVYLGSISAARSFTAAISGEALCARWRR